MSIRVELLEFIAKNENGVGFHQIVRRFGVLDADLNLIDELNLLMREGLIEERRPQDLVQSRYYFARPERK